MFQPVGDHILVKPDAREEMTKSGIVLPGSAQQKPQTGTVISVGSGKHFNGTLVTFESQGITKGATVMFSKYGPTEITLNDEEYFILEMHDILGVIKD
jgi:chaperonin GroES